MGVVDRLGPFKLCNVGLEAVGDPTFEQWEKAGHYLQSAHGAVQWWLGDWVNYGESRWGEKYAQAINTTRLDDGTLRNVAWVCRRFDLSWRHDKLTFAHHQEVASLPPAEAHRLLHSAAATDPAMTTRALRQLVRQSKAAIANNAPPSNECCTVEHLGNLVARGVRFGTIYADPPWDYENQGTRAATGNHYLTMGIDDIADLPVKELAAEQSHLHLWTTNAFLESALSLIPRWGFEFKSTFVWVKPQLGIGNYWRCSHEILLLGVKGGLTFPPNGTSSWLAHKRQRHSAKPEKIRALIEQFSPAPRLELFGRRVHGGWTVWGNEVMPDRTLMDGPILELAGE